MQLWLFLWNILIDFFLNVLPYFIGNVWVWIENIDLWLLIVKMIVFNWTFVTSIRLVRWLSWSVSLVSLMQTSLGLWYQKYRLFFIWTFTDNILWRSTAVWVYYNRNLIFWVLFVQLINLFTTILLRFVNNISFNMFLQYRLFALLMIINKLVFSL